MDKAQDVGGVEIRIKQYLEVAAHGPPMGRYDRSTDHRRFAAAATALQALDMIDVVGDGESLRDDTSAKQAGVVAMLLLVIADSVAAPKAQVLKTASSS